MFKKLKKAVSGSISRRRLQKLAGKGKVKTVGGKTAKKEAYSKAAQKRKAKHAPGMEKIGKVSKGAVSAVATKGGTYVKYKKKSKAAGSFRSAFKSKCAGGAKSFTWQGRSYSCAKASDKKKTVEKKKPAAKKGTNPGQFSFRGGKEGRNQV